jgi:AcrR family transcriptional regulator
MYVSSVSAGAGLRERKKAQTRTAFIDAASELFAKRGYDTVTVEDICAAVDVSPRTFFRYFSAKADLVVAAVTDMLGELLDDLRARPDGERAGDSLREVLLQAGDRIARQKPQYLSMARVIRAAPELVGGNAAAFMDWEGEMTSEVARRLAPAAAAHARLLAGVTLTAFRVAMDEWVEGDGKGSARERIKANLDLVEPAARRLERP